MVEAMNEELEILPGQTEDGRDEELHLPTSYRCKWCFGSGRMRVSGSSQTYMCQDCEGRGRISLETEKENDL